MKDDTETTFAGGTLIISIPCRAGVVVCADRLVTTINTDATSASSAKKIFAIGSNGIFGIAGTTSAHGSNGRVLYSLETELLRYLRTIDARLLDRRIREINTRLGELMKALTAGAPPDFAPPGYVSGSDFFTVQFWHRTLQKDIRGFKLRAVFDWGGTRRGNVTVNEIVSGRLATATPLAIGMDAPLNELRFGSEPAFDQFRNDTDMLRLYGHSVASASEIDTSEAERLARKLVSVAVEMMQIKGVPLTVGTQTDGALLSREGGYESLWSD